MIISIISAIGKNNEIGKGNALLWDLPQDMKYFRETTSGHPVIMGRKTFESIGRPLPKRRNIIITRDTNYNHEGAEIVHSLYEAFNLFSSEEVFVIGGSEIYKQAIERADKLYITHVDGKFEADSFFPPIDVNMWKETKKEHFEKDEQNNFSMDFTIYEKLAK